MNFELTDEQALIESTVHGLLEDRFPDERLRALTDAGGDDFELWDELCRLGYAGLLVPAAYGGQDLGVLELGLAVEALGYRLAPVPLLAHAAAVLAIASAGDARQRQAHLPDLATGALRGGFATDGVATSGLVPDLVGADRLVVVGDGQALIADDAEIRPVETIDLTRRYGGATDAAGLDLPGDSSHVLDAIEVLLAAELTGVAQRALDLAVAYASERHQFGRPIGSFQGVSHRCAVMLVDVEAARSTWRYAAWVADNEPKALPLAASTAKVAGVHAATQATASSLQVHGGIGFTWEHLSHLLLRRAYVVATVLSGADAHRQRIVHLNRRVHETLHASVGDGA